MADRKPNKLTTEKPIQNGPFKVFFIASNQSSLDDKLNYSLKKWKEKKSQMTKDKVEQYWQEKKIEIDNFEKSNNKSI